MDICRNLIKLEKTVVGLGFFDGVHLGHQELIKFVVDKAKECGLKSVILTFKKSPAEKFIDNVEYLTTNREKECLMENLGVDYLFEIDFDEKIMCLSPKEYLDEILIKYFSPKFIFSGYNHTFGKDKSGDVSFLDKYSNEGGYEFIEIPPVDYDGIPISSTKIRSLLKAGNVVDASFMLGHNFSLSGKVIQGNKIGRTIGFPTANILYPEKKVKIPFGVYSVFVLVGDNEYQGVLNYGVKPTINSLNQPILEVFIDEFDENIYNKIITLKIIKKIRDERKFDSLDELKSQIEKDLKEC